MLGKFYLRQLPKVNWGSSFMSLRKKKTHQRFTLEKLKETSNLVIKAQHWNTARLCRPPGAPSLRGRDVLGVHYVCGESGKLQEGCFWKCGHKGPPGCVSATHTARLRIQLCVLMLIWRPTRFVTVWQQRVFQEALSIFYLRQKEASLVSPACV